MLELALYEYTETTELKKVASFVVYELQNKIVASVILELSLKFC